jgi:hypothetical protein
MAQITSSWNGRDTSPEDKQLVFACIGELKPGSPRGYIVARYYQEVGGSYLSHHLYNSDRQEERISAGFLIAWQPLEIAEPEW